MSKKSAKARKKRFYFHVTDVKNVKKILAKGLKGTITPRNRSEDVGCPTVFVLSTSEEVLTNAIAREQIWPFEDIESYAVIKIDSKGVSGPIVEDICGEITTERWQWMVQQPLIKPEFLTLERIHEEFYPGRAVWDLTQRICIQRKWTQDEWELAAKYVSPFLVLQRLSTELQRARSAKVLELLAFIEDAYSQEQFAQLHPYLKEWRKEIEQKFRAKDTASKRRAK